MLPGGVRPPPPTRSATEQSSKPPTPPLPRPVRVYLLAYNVGAMYLWTVIGATVYQTTTEIQVEIPALGKLLDSIRHPWAYSPYNHSVYGAVGGLLCVTQTLALVELLHSVLGWVRSPPTAVATQLLARLWCVWAVSEHSRIAAESSWYAVMVLSWSISELVRYPLYALGLVGSSSSVLVWARYTFFLVLYPLGCLAESSLMYRSLPPWGLWGPLEYINSAFMVLWWGGLYVMYSYMLAQRRKVLHTIHA